MAIEVEVKRRLICDKCLKPMTEFAELNATSLRDSHVHPPYRGKDYCVDCHPLPLEKRNLLRGRKKASFYTGMKKDKS